jgi:hypothetical protein
LTEAYRCWSQGRRFLPSTMGTVPAGRPSIRFSVTFKCLSPNDSE